MYYSPIVWFYGQLVSIICYGLSLLSIPEKKYFDGNKSGETRNKIFFQFSSSLLEQLFL